MDRLERAKEEKEQRDGRTAAGACQGEDTAPSPHVIDIISLDKAVDPIDETRSHNEREKRHEVVDEDAASCSCS